MKKRQLIQSIVLSSFFFGSFIQAEIIKPSENEISASQEAELAEITEFAQEMVARSFYSLQKIENKLTEIALLVKKGLFKKQVNPSAIMQVLTENKMTINALLQNQAAIIALKDPAQQLEIAFVISEFCNAFIPYLNKQITSHFDKAKPFKLEKFLKSLQKRNTRSGFEHLEPTSLIRGLQRTDAKLKILDVTVQNIGLTWYNKSARALDKWVITPANKYNIPTIAGYTAGIGLVGLYSLWHYGDFFRDTPGVPETLKNLVKNHLLINNRGPLRETPYKIYIVGAETSDKDNAEWGARQSEQSIPTEDKIIPHNASTLATTDFAITKFMSNSHPAVNVGIGYMFSSLFKTWNEDVYPKLMKKRDQTWNFLRGGEYLNTFQPGLVAMKPTVSFKDMVGLDEVKEAFYSILQYIDNPEQLMRIEATPEKGWLLTGPTRTGKSFSVECLCGEIELMMQKRGMAKEVKFFNISATLVNEYGIKAILDEVYENAPAVIFLDEIDLLGLQRVGNNKLLSDFLTAMQSSMNADPSKIVIVIAATNNPENIDKALRQNGRFGKEIRFEYPSKKYRMQFITRELTNMAINLSEFDIETLANKTNGKSFEDLKRVIRNAMTRSWMYSTSLTQDLLEQSIDTEIHNIIMFKRKELPENERRIVATHFAGRAVAAMNLETHEQFDKITIYARMTELKEEGVWENYSKKDEKDQQKKIEYGAYLTKKANDTINVKSEQLILNEVTLLLSGFAAEELLLGPCGFTCHRNDRDKAYKMIEDLVFGGLNQEVLPKKEREQLKSKAFLMLKQCQEKAMALLVSHRDALNAIIEELLKKEILNDKEIQAIISTTESAVIETPVIAEPTIPEENASSITTETQPAIEIVKPTTEEMPTNVSSIVIDAVIKPATEIIEVIAEPIISEEDIKPILTETTEETDIAIEIPSVETIVETDEENENLEEIIA
jgi:cell division protease FtsH